MKVAIPRPAVPPRFLYALALAVTAAIFAFDLSTPLDPSERQLYLIPFVLLWWAPSPYLLYAAAGVITILMALPLALPFAVPSSFPLPAVPEGELLFNNFLGISLVWAGAYMLVRHRRAEESQIRSLRRLELMTSTAGELLRAPKPQEAMDTLCRRVMEHLDCHVFFNFLADEKAGKLRLNACAGIPQEEARRIEWLEYGSAVCGCAAREGRRIVAEQIPSTPDERTELVKSYGVKAYACHPLLGPGGKVLGTLSFGTRSRETFGGEDLSLMKAVADHVAVAMTRMKDEEALRESLAEKDNLLRELSHRTKNNMQVIVGLLALQASKPGEARLSAALGKVQDRIRAMALVHENLYRSGSAVSLTMKDYIRDLLDSLLKSHHGAPGTVTTMLELEEIFLSLDDALPCGLILNELVTNSLQHAFRRQGAGIIHISLRRLGKEIELRYRDDGPGLPPGLDPSKTDSLGLKLVHNLAVRQLRGTMALVRDPAPEFRFRFPLSTRAGERISGFASHAAPVEKAS